MTNKIGEVFDNYSIPYLLGFFAATPILRVADVSVFILFLTVVAILSAFDRVNRSGRLSKEPNPFIAVLLFSLLSLLFSFYDHSVSGKTAYIVGSVKALIALFLGWTVAECAFRGRSDRFKRLLNGVAFAGVCNAVWMIIQKVFWIRYGFDLNGLIFNQVLHMTETTSQYKASGLVATGLCWNVGGVAAAILLALVLYKNLGIRVLLVVGGFVSGSRTLEIGILSICAILFFNCIRRFFRSRGRDREKVFLVFSALLFIAVALLLSPWLWGKVESLDSSGSAHLAYYTNLPQLISRMDLGELLFGYGIDASGDPYTNLTGQYHWLDAWFVESDPVNVFLGTGLFGFLSTYYWLCFTIKKVSRRSRELGIFILTVIGLGLFYNLLSVTYYWLTFILICADYSSGPCKESVAGLSKGLSYRGFEEK